MLFWRKNSCLIEDVPIVYHKRTFFLSLGFSLLLLFILLLLLLLFCLFVCLFVCLLICLFCIMTNKG